jgi:hypothetical protein
MNEGVTSSPEALFQQIRAYHISRHAVEELLERMISKDRYLKPLFLTREAEVL